LDDEGISLVANTPRSICFSAETRKLFRNQERADGLDASSPIFVNKLSMFVREEGPQGPVPGGWTAESRKEGEKQELEGGEN
jgi:hypothetical protein